LTLQRQQQMAPLGRFQNVASAIGVSLAIIERTLQIDEWHLRKAKINNNKN